jgi:A/G-specific adenine glycosylase
LAWYGRHARDLPWRRDRDPYRVWVSEVMLQQTTVAAVQPYFERFIAALPTIADLACAREDRVLRLWEGLGYYRRARQLHRAAKIIVAEHGGRFPVEAAAVRRLPGIGRYTAGAILSIAFDQPAPILEANTVRLLSRLLAYRGDTRSAVGQRLLWSAAEGLLPRKASGRFNQALMELGSQVCKPRDPVCTKCPVAEICPTHRDGLHNLIPALRPKPRIEEIREAAVVVRRRGRVLLVRCGEGERWAGLWDFPRFAYDGANGSPAAGELQAKVRRRTDVGIGSPQPLTTIRHTVTRFRITLDCFEATASESAGRHCSPVEVKWLRPAELADYPLSSTGRKLARLIAASAG